MKAGENKTISYPIVTNWTFSRISLLSLRRNGESDKVYNNLILFSWHMKDIGRENLIKTNIVIPKLIVEFTGLAFIFVETVLIAPITLNVSIYALVAANNIKLSLQSYKKY